MTLPTVSPRTERQFRAGAYVTAFADASYCPNTGAYGWCFWVKFGEPAQTVVESGGGLGLTNSGAAEIEAVRQALKFLNSIDLTARTVVMQTDCQQAIRELGPQLGELTRVGALAAYFKHVKGHRGTACPRSAVNSLCDRRARAEMRRRRGP